MLKGLYLGFLVSPQRWFVGLFIGEGPLVAVGREGPVGPELVLEKLGPGLGVFQRG